MFKTRKAKSAISPGTEAFSSSDVSRISGVSLRQLQWWDERNVVSPRHDGHRRVYTQAEVVEITVIAELRRKGFSLQKIRRVLRFLQKEMNRGLAEAVSGTVDIHLLTDGKTIYIAESSDRVIDILKNAKQAMFLVCVSDQARRLEAPPRKPARAETTSAARKSKVS
jgi:DNA-binding transcriptional MerR regulator